MNPESCLFYPLTISTLKILPDIPQPNTEQELSQLRSPLRQGPAGPTRSSTLPAHLSPGPGSRRTQLPPSDNSNGSARSSHQVDERRSKRTSTEAPSAHQLPIHSGPPQSRAAYSPPVSDPAPVSPYATQPEARRGYPATVPNSRVRSPETLAYPGGTGQASGLPPPPMQYPSGVNAHSSYEYDSGREQRNSGYDAYYGDSRNRAAPAYPPSNAPYNSVQPGYPLPPPGNAYCPAPPAHQYQNGYHAMQFEAEDIGNAGPRRRRGNLPRDTTDLLKSWFSDHLAHPYPTEDEKQMLCRRTGLAMTQISNWFINARRRRIPELMNQATAETRLRENSDFQMERAAPTPVKIGMRSMYARAY
ncbi:hypothetical protein OEA41_008470 [Lepraria neglecta]|uniref:Homeobox domain-containing protein n=1 Tax=Lepraria neglecta TaxID=209136 RepID=A0AAD9ZER3_9LECA|nr:hypothetical protein OEA41_008470 [Lepraria neglecta]